MPDCEACSSVVRNSARIDTLERDHAEMKKSIDKLNSTVERGIGALIAINFGVGALVVLPVVLELLKR